MPDRLLVVAPNWLGDAVMALPAIADLRRHHASARVVVAARGSVAPLFSMVPGVDEVVTLQWKGRPLDRAGLHEDARRLADLHADAAVLLPNSFGTAWLARAAGIPERWGYARDMRRWLLTRAVRRPSRGIHQGTYYQDLVRELGIANGPLEPVIDVPASVVAGARRLLSAHALRDGGAFVVMAPGAAYGTAKRWLPGHFATLIASENGVGGHLSKTVLIGSAADGETTRMIVDALPASHRDRVIDLTGKTSLVELAGVLRLARICVSNDSGAMHMAGAVGTPVVALFGPTREKETAPLARSGVERRVLINPVWCRPCMLRECPIDHRCMRGLAPARVRASVDELLVAQP